MTDVIMPKMGDGMEEGTLLEWLKKDGDKVKSGEVIGTIQTDKATLELEAPSSGILTGFLIKEGETVPVGQPIAAILKEGENLPAEWASGKAAKAAAPAAGGPKVAEARPGAEVQAPANAPIQMQQEAASDPRLPSGASAEVGVTAPQPAATAQPAGTLSGTGKPYIEGSANGGRIKASPLARRVAQEKGVDLATVSGSGPGGRIVERDVLAAAERGPVAAPAAPAVAASAEDQVVQLNRLRQITAQRTTQSKQQVPHFYVTVEVDVERIMQLREMFEQEESGKVSINDFVVKACAHALRDMPEVNAVFQGATVLQHGGVNVGIAIAIPDGLTVAVIKNADQLSLRQISARSKELVKKAHDNKLTMDELSGSTFSISNMGMLDVDNFLAIINQPNSAILAVASARKRVVVSDEDEVEIRHRMNITCSFDHRVVDGAVGAKFINVVRAYLENPTRLL